MAFGKCYERSSTEQLFFLLKYVKINEIHNEVNPCHVRHSTRTQSILISFNYR